jgi:hypothetical protein
MFSPGKIWKQQLMFTELLGGGGGGENKEIKQKIYAGYKQKAEKNP